MKNLNKVAVLFASAALVAPLAAFAQSNDNWRAGDGTVWKNGTNELCWRNGSWTPATADQRCDGAIRPPAPAPRPRAGPPVPPPRRPRPPPRRPPSCPPRR
ncbi:hypothetical protein LRS07_09965 [Aquabacterium sp. J223]|nr:hypothetical protein LRS07_09965 [Aquabacterium sp. J223]